MKTTKASDLIKGLSDDNKELIDRAEWLMVHLLPPVDYGENSHCEELYNIIVALGKATVK